MSVLRRLALLLLLASPAAAVPNFGTKDFNVRVTSASIQAATGAAYPLRFFYIRGSTAVYSATSADGLALVEEADVRLSTNTQPPLDIAISSITGLAIQSLTAGGFRMLYSVIGTTGSYRIYTATSADGLAWANSTGAVVDAGTSFAGHPSVVKLASGDWRLYYVQNSIAGDQFANHKIYTALSSNEGRNFGAASLSVNAVAGQVSAVKLTNNRVRVYYTTPPAAGVSTHTALASALSDNVSGTSMNIESGFRLSTGSGLGAISNPFVVRSTDSFRWRAYYNFTPFQSVAYSTPDAWSAVTDSPDIQSITPSSVLRNQVGPTATILGEIFSPAPTALLRKGGEADINGAGLTRSDDQTITATFNTLNQALGFWDVVVTNANTLSGSLTNGLLIDFAGGSVRAVDNLLRPRNGTVTSFNITTFNDGNVTAKVYTTDGRLVATLLEGHVLAGTTTTTWNGRTAGGALAASGVYIVRITGPKLDAINKVVLIK